MANAWHGRVRGGLSHRARAFVFATPLYDLLLRRAGPVRLRACPPPAWPSDTETGQAILGGSFPLAGQRLVVDDVAALPAEAGPGWLAGFHAFGWLDSLRLLGAETARRKACELVDRWLEAYGSWSAQAWRADTLANRLCHWLQNQAFLCEPANGFDEERFARAVAGQARHLKRVARVEIDGEGRIRAFKALVLCAVGLEAAEREREEVLAGLAEEVARQVNPDGGHLARSPAVQMAVLRDLLDVRSLLAAERLPVPEWLQGAVDRMVPMLRGLRHGDGRLALFNGAREGRREDVDVTLAEAGVKSKPLANAPHTGFQRLSGGRTLVIFDSGAPPPAGFDAGAHAGIFSFEMSVGRERVVVNCGSASRPDGEWAQALRATAAHSTLGVEDMNAAELLEDGTLGRRPSEVAARRRELDGNILVEASHDGYRAGFGIVHRRTLYLAPDGSDFRGEDVVEGPGSRVFAVRFHLHPGVQASMVQDGRAILIKLPSGAGWQFRCSGSTVRLEDSVYFGDGEPRRCQQIVVLDRLDRGSATVKWRFASVG